MAATVDTLTVVIANWRTADLTIRSAKALIDDGVPAQRIVVVENGSDDDSLERLRVALPDCVLVPLAQNIGYARASNRGAWELAGDAYLFVNNDAFVHRPGTVATLLASLERERVGIVAPRLLNEDLSLQSSVVPTTSPQVALVRASGLSRLIPNRWQPKWSTHWDHASSREIESADGPVLLVHGQAWKELGGYDEEMLMYAEDLDLCLRARRAGWRIWFAHEAEFVHLGGRATGKEWDSPTRAELIGLSEGRMIRRHLSRPSAALTIGFIAAGLALRWLVFTVLRRRDATASLAGSLRGFLGQPQGPVTRP